MHTHFPLKLSFLKTFPFISGYYEPTIDFEIDKNQQMGAI